MKPSERYKIEHIKQQYPPGTRLELKEMDDPHAPVQPGTRGTVAAVDDMGTIHMKWDNGRTLGVVPGVDQFRKLTAQEIQAEQEIKISPTTAAELRSLTKREGLVLQGCGGDLREWVSGINSLLEERGVFEKGTGFQEAQVFRKNGLTNLLLPFKEDMKLDMGKLAMWRLETYNSFGSMWLSDYVDIHLGGPVNQQKDQTRQKPDCPLIGQDGNIFNLMGIASRTLKEHGMSEEAKQMQKEITQCESYGAALNVIGQYVNITSVDEEEDLVDSMRME